MRNEGRTNSTLRAISTARTASASPRLTYLSHLLFGSTYLSHSHQIVCVHSIPDTHVQQNNLMFPDRVIAFPKKEDDMDVRTDERLLRNIEGYMMELVCNVKSIDEVDLIADVLVSVQDALRALTQKPRN